MSSAAIGLFDSGIGGSSIWQALQTELPQENTCYLADNANAPYGDKSPSEILALCEADCAFLIERGCKLIIIACNTATALAAAALRSRYRLPIIGVEPAVKPAALATHSGSIGVLATKATLASEKFLAGVENHVKSKGIKLLARSGSGLVELIENNQLHSKEMAALLDVHCSAFAAAGIDQLVLGCTHYPYLRAQLAARLPQVNIIDSGAAVARHTRRILAAAQLLNPQPPHQAQHEWFSTGDSRILAQFAPSGDSVKQIRLSQISAGEAEK